MLFSHTYLTRVSDCKDTTFFAMLQGLKTLNLILPNDFMSQVTKKAYLCNLIRVRINSTIKQ